jgi:Protein of unknown function (DUF3489)
LIKEIRAKPGMPVWRRDEDEARSFALTITRAGRKAINVEPDDVDSLDDVARNAPRAGTSPDGRVRQARKSRSDDASTTAPSTKASPGTEGPRAGSKLALVIGMLCDTGGATIDAIVSATGWLPHTTRAALTGLRKRGYRIERARSEKGTTLYRIVTRNRNAA